MYQQQHQQEQEQATSGLEVDNMADCKKYDRTPQVMPSAAAETKEENGITITCDGKGTYTVSGTATANVEISFTIPEFTIPISVGQGGNGTLSFFNTVYNTNYKITIRFKGGDTLIDSWSLNVPNRTNTSYLTLGDKICNKIVLSVEEGVTTNGTFAIMFTDDGQLPLTYQPYYDWFHSLRKLTTDTDILTLPQTIYGDGTNATITLKGNTEQSGTPSPQNPVDVVGVGELETSGEHAGQYKIPILNGSLTTNVYLGEVESTRKIAKYEFTGNESYYAYNYGGTSGVQVTYILDSNKSRSQGYCNIYPVSTSAGTVHCVWLGSGGGDRTVYFVSILTDMGMSTIDEFKSYVQQQYAAGTPVTVWYVLATPTTGITNEPLMKIGSYADSLTTSIPTTDGANALSIDTTVQPSEVTATYHGWHPVQSAHERDSGQWD